MILVLEDRDEPLFLNIDTTNVPIALHNDVLMTSELQKFGFYGFLLKTGWFFKYLPKILGICDFDGIFANHEKKWLS